MPIMRRAPREAGRSAARSSGMPWPGAARADRDQGIGRGTAGQRRLRLGDAAGEVGRLHLVGLGENELVGDGALVERVHDRRVDLLQAVPGIDEQEDARQVGAAAQVVVDEPGPRLDLGLRHRRIAVAGHVDQREAAADVEEVELLRAPGRVGGPRQRLATGERVDEARLADVRAAGKGDLDASSSAAATRPSRRPR